MKLEDKFEKDWRAYMDASINYAMLQEPIQAISSEDELAWIKGWIRKNM